jgi:hypothetical protein
LVWVGILDGGLAAEPLWRVAWAKFEMRNGKLAFGRGRMADFECWILDGGLLLSLDY